MLLTIDMA